MTAYMTSPSSTSDTNWYPDTGSTNHLTNDLQNLNLHLEPYHGSDQIYIGNGADLPIKNIGSATISTPTHSFTLSQLLYVPQIKKNLISVNQFTSENNAYIEFHLSFFGEGRNHGENSNARQN